MSNCRLFATINDICKVLNILGKSLIIKYRKDNAGLLAGFVRQILNRGGHDLEDSKNTVTVETLFFVAERLVKRLEKPSLQLEKHRQNHGAKP